MKGATWDAVVIGGGPAGCSSAITLAERGLRVALFESQTYPHDKLCGEFLSPECAGLLTQLGVSDQLAAVNPIPIHSVTVTEPGGSSWEGKLPGTALGISRKVLDALLAEHARHVGVEVHEASTVDGVTGKLDQGFDVSVRTHRQGMIVKARSVIAAHGKRGGLDRVLGRKFLAQHHPFVAIKAHFHGPSIPNSIRLHAFPGGYCGMSDIEGGAQVMCLLVQENTFQQARSGGQLDAFIAWMQKQNPAIHAWLGQAERIHERWIAIAQVPFTSKASLEGDVLMAGDSAGLIPPLAGNGISMALDGGRMAADHLAQFLTGQVSADELRLAYPAAWRKRFGLRLGLARRLQPILLRPQALSLALKVINTFPWMGQSIVRLTRGPVHLAEEKMSGHTRVV